MTQDTARDVWFSRANRFRQEGEFDRALGILESILEDNPNDAEVYWSMALCRYGVVYSDASGAPVSNIWEKQGESHAFSMTAFLAPMETSRNLVRTIHRMSDISILDDPIYRIALDKATEMQKRAFEDEASTIDEIQKRYRTIIRSEESFDVFISYKESDLNGRRTHDSELAYDLYKQLEELGYKVFYSRVTLERRIGEAWEPHIFAALNSAKVMIVLGTKGEYFNAPWVRNEWSRYLKLMKDDGGKVLIPAYVNMSPSELPDELIHLQSQDMSKIGAAQDVIAAVVHAVSPDRKQPLRHVFSFANRRKSYFSKDAGRESSPYLEDLRKKDKEFKITELRRGCAMTIVVIFAMIFIMGIAYHFLMFAVSETEYREALSTDDALEAVLLFEQMERYGGYRDSAERIQDIKEAAWDDVEVGDTLWLGTYLQGIARDESDEQVSDSGFVKEDIAWRVLDIQNERALLLSVYALDAQPYNEYLIGEHGNDWNNSSIRDWLNTAFLETAFTEEDLSIVDSEVFLLSEEDALNDDYFGNGESRCCDLTNYAYYGRAFHGENGCCVWWLGSSGSEDYYAMYVDDAGNVRVDGTYVDATDVAVRPAIWIAL